MNAYYKIYVESCINLVGSFIYQFKGLADSMNRELTDLGEAIPTDKTKWRYYMHLAGDYHAYDNVMRIISLDTGEEIDYTKANLAIHKKTQNVYYNTPKYLKELIGRYPKQSILVKGILYPVDYNVSLNAQDGTIFHYDTTLVEPQELTFITNVEDLIRTYLNRYVMESYTITDDLYIPGVMGMLTTVLVKGVIDIRNKATRTAEVHTFHIERYLASHNRVDEFLPYMTFEQKLWFYLNIANLERNTGMQKTFDVLVEKLMTLRGLPMYEYRLRQKSIDLTNELLAPEPIFTRGALNLERDLLARTVDAYTIPNVTRKEVPDALDNSEYLDVYTEKAITLTQDASISNLPTKIVECSAVDPEDFDPTKTTDVILSEWFYLTATGKYLNNIDIINPVTGNIMKLDMRQAVLLFLYSYYQGNLAVTLTKLPVVPAMGVARLRWISDSEYLKRIPYSQFNVYQDDIDFFQATYYELTKPLLNASAFIEACDAIVNRKRLRHQYTNIASRHSVRGVRKMLFNTSYVNVYCHFDALLYSNYEEFFTFIGLDTTMMYEDTWKDLALAVLDAATLYDTKSTMSLREIQKAMIKLFKRLSGYSVQFLQEVTSSDTSGGHCLVVLPDTTDESIYSDATALLPPMHAIQQATTHVGNITNTGPTVKTLSVLDKYKYVADAQFTLQVNLVHKPDYKHAVIIPTITAVTATFKGVNPLTALTEVGNNGLVYLTV